MNSRTQPSLIIVTGRPGSGKTTLAHALAREVRCPAICRDEIKEGFLTTSGQDPESGGDDVTRRVYETFFDAVRLLLDHGMTLVAEAAFQHHRWAPKLEPLRDVAHIRIVVCAVDPQLARLRCIERRVADPQRERFHPDPPPMQGYDPPHLDVPTLTVDTTDGYRPVFEQVVSFVRA